MEIQWPNTPPSLPRLPPTCAARAGTCDLVFTNGKKLPNIPTATTPAEKSAGLSNREDISPGMVFIWPTAELRAFWMKDTKKPISIGFFDKDKVLFQIVDMQPMTKNLHFSEKKAVIALELPAGDYEKEGIKVGDTIQDCGIIPL